MHRAHSHCIAQLKERRPEIADFLLCCERDHLTPQDRTAMRNCVRAIIALGMDGDASRITVLAQSMQLALSEKTPASRIDLLSLGRTLLYACNAALRTTDAGAEPAVFHPAAPLASGFRKPTILSVDDDRIIGTMMEAMFGGYADILTAANGKQGLEMIRLHRPSLVLLDDAMPQMSGMAVLDALKKEEEVSSIAVIMLTSSDRPQDIARATAAGAVDYVIKPFDPRMLAEKVYRQLASR